MLQFLKCFNLIFFIFLAISYLYQLVYAAVGLTSKRFFAEPEAKKEHKFAAVISARNEERVIGELITSLIHQQYSGDKLDIFVVADNCTDHTAEAAQSAGAVVFRRYNPDETGKGYALDYLFRRILRDYGDRGYEGYFIFDADNIVDKHFVSEMNKTFDRGGYDAITCYRSSKNFGSNWLSACYSIWFLQQCRFLNFPRSLLGVSCGVGGTGFMISDRMVRSHGGWPFHLLTEDIEFSADCAVSGHTIGYCDRAVIFDEQPTSFRQSWSQRLRWSKGHYQVGGKYTLPLLRGSFQGGKRGLTCYDAFLSVTPGAFLILAVMLLNLSCALFCQTQPVYMAAPVLFLIGRFLILLGVGYYILTLITGTLTVISEWRRIPASRLKKLIYLPLYPLFILTYLPIGVAALFCKVEWKPIRHTSVAEAHRTPDGI